MGFADNLRKEISNTNEQIIATKYEPRKAEIMGILERGIKRIGYVQIDTSGYCAGTMEGTQIGAKQEDLNALYEFLRAEGFVVNKMWWGWGGHGSIPDMLKITL